MTNNDSETIVQKCYYDLFFKKLYLEGYINLQSAIDKIDYNKSKAKYEDKKNKRFYNFFYNKKSINDNEKKISDILINLPSSQINELDRFKGELDENKFRVLYKLKNKNRLHFLEKNNYYNDNIDEKYKLQGALEERYGLNDYELNVLKKLYENYGKEDIRLLSIIIQKFNYEKEHIIDKYNEFISFEKTFRQVREVQTNKYKDFIESFNKDEYSRFSNEDKLIFISIYYWSTKIEGLYFDKSINSVGKIDNYIEKIVAKGVEDDKFILFTINYFKSNITSMQKTLKKEIKEFFSFRSDNNKKNEELFLDTIGTLTLKINENYIYDTNRVEINKIKNISQVTDIIDQYKKSSKSFNEELFFRGQSNSNYLLEPSIIRTPKRFKNEHRIYEECLVRNPEEFNFSNRTHLDVLKKMQHYGVPTRLIDITDNLLIALYFAIETNNGTDGELLVFSISNDKLKYTRSDSVAILCSLPPFNRKSKSELAQEANWNSKIEDFNQLSILKRLKHEVSSEKPFEPEIRMNTIKEDFFVIPTRDNRRIIQQSGAFIVTCLNIYSYGAINDYRFSKIDKSEKDNLKKIIFIIPKENKSEYKSILSQYGINKGTVYPEIEKVSEYLINKFEL